VCSFKLRTCQGNHKKNDLSLYVNFCRVNNKENKIDGVLNNGIPSDVRTCTHVLIYLVGERVIRIPFFSPAHNAAAPFKMDLADLYQKIYYSLFSQKVHPITQLS
jgi:hypothetical protein